MERAKAHLDECGDEECKFCLTQSRGNSTLICCFGLRNTSGCPREDPAVSDRIREAAVLMLKAEVAKYEDPEGKGLSDLNRLAESRMNKVFNFVFDGHEYRASDSARVQSKCPHCDYKNPSGDMFCRDSPGVTYLGSKHFGDHTAECFECNQCFKKFFYHHWGVQL